jgi:hypothetical protein
MRTETSSLNCWFDFPMTPRLTADPKVVRQIAREFPGSRGRHPVPWDRAGEALSVFESLEPLPANPWGMAPVWLCFTAGFRILSPGGQELWPGQDPSRFGHFVTPGGVGLGASSSRLMVHAQRALALSLSIPRASDTDLAEVVPWLQAALPMRLSARHWTRWTLTRNKRSYRGRKIEPVSLAQPDRS